MIAFFVPGLPAPQGSKRAFVNKHTGRVNIVEDSKRVKPWREDVRGQAIDAMAASGGRRSGPVGLTLTFFLPRPKGHHGTGRNAEILRPGAPVHPTVKPDVDKLARAVLDALAGVVFVDDAQVVDLTVRKRYVEQYATLGNREPGLTVSIDT